MEAEGHRPRPAGLDPRAALGGRRHGVRPAPARLPRRHPAQGARAGPHARRSTRGPARATLIVIERARLRAAEDARSWSSCSASWASRDRKVLILTDGRERERLLSSAATCRRCDVMPYSDVSAYDILWADVVVIEEPARSATRSTPVRRRGSRRAEEPCAERRTPKAEAEGREAEGAAKKPAAKKARRRAEKAAKTKKAPKAAAAKHAASKGDGQEAGGQEGRPEEEGGSNDADTASDHRAAGGHREELGGVPGRAGNTRSRCTRRRTSRRSARRSSSCSACTVTGVWTMQVRRNAVTAWAGPPARRPRWKKAIVTAEGGRHDRRSSRAEDHGHPSIQARHPGHPLPVGLGFRRDHARRRPRSRCSSRCKKPAAAATTRATSRCGYSGGGHKRMYRMIDFKRNKFGDPGDGDGDRVRSEPLARASRWSSTPTARSATSCTRRG